MASTPTTIQPMPPLAPEQYRALRDDIAANGIIVPIITDQHGRILDGNNRAAIAVELGIDCPCEIRAVDSDIEAVDIAVTLNCARRHLSREQVRDVIRAELIRRPEDSDRAIARRVGCSHRTVAAVRNPVVDNLPTRAEAEARAQRIREAVTGLEQSLWAYSVTAMSNKIPAVEIAHAIMTAHRALQRDGLDEHGAFGRIYGRVIDWLLDPDTPEEWREHWDHETFLPWTADEKAGLLARLAEVR